MFTTSDGQYDINPAHVTHIEASSHPNLRIVHLVGGERVSVSASDAKLLRITIDEHLYAMAPKSGVL